MASRSILVVDDESWDSRTIKCIFYWTRDTIVRLAENAHIAREERLKQRPDLVLLDIWMPDCDGISLLKERGNSAC